MMNRIYTPLLESSREETILNHNRRLLFSTAASTPDSGGYPTIENKDSGNVSDSISLRASPASIAILINDNANSDFTDVQQQESEIIVKTCQDGHCQDRHYNNKCDRN